MEKNNKSAWVFFSLFVFVCSFSSLFNLNSESREHRKTLDRFGYDSLSKAETKSIDKKCKTLKYKQFCKTNKLGEYRQ